MRQYRQWITADTYAVLILLALWLFFFWRLFTPIEADQASIKQGDFSGQFVAFAAYQYQRIAAGEVPLWNPYNNGGLPFIGDTQAAVFYPPRLATIGLSKLAGGFSYHALELEMTVHVLACALMMYAFIRRLTLGNPGSVFGAFVAAVIASYGGFLQSYPPLQLALLEAVIWMPLATLGILEATRQERIRWAWLTLTGLALGLSWMAGHPQSSFFLTYLLVAYFAYRAYAQRYNWRIVLIGIILFGLLTGGLAAVQLLPGFEYLLHTARAGMGFDEKGNGFPFQDVVQFIFPNIVTLWSPLFVGITGLTLALIALWRRLSGSLFWGIVVIVALGLSFGGNSPIFDLLFNLVPGMRFFRGQERAAYLVSFGLAILAGMGAAHILSWDKLQDFKATRRIQQVLLGLVIICGVVAGAVLIMWLGNNEAYGKYISLVAFSFLSALLVFLLIPFLLNNPQQPIRYVLVGGLLVFELFTLSMDSSSNYDSISPDEQLSFTPSPLIATALTDTDIHFRVDGYRALHDNYGSLYGLADMRGISPLFLEGPFNLINSGLINPLAWELFAVRYVYTDWNEMPVSSEIIASGQDRYGEVKLHRLTDPRPFALLIYTAQIVEDDEQARSALSDPNFNARRTIILNQDPGILTNGDIPEDAEATVTTFKPETFTLEVNTPHNAVLSVSHPDYPGWYATVDGEPAPILRAYGALSAVTIPSGEHTVTFVYNPLSYRIGAIISLLTWAGMVVMGVILLARRRHVRN
ncbi:MAG: YfhO family protein [Anaerolineae bacterium]|nr:YfhO family protein [Anaerolineae bacterium]